MSNPEDWKTFAGRVVDGKLPLRQWLGGSEHSAVFLTERPGQSSSKAAIKLIAPDSGPERQLAQWRSAAELSHPHLMRIYESGRSRLASKPDLYVVMEYAEEDVSQILPQRPLAPAEVTDLLPPVLDALSYLHAKGFVHGRIKPSNIMAVGDQLKLSADQITPAAEMNSERRRRDVYDAPETAAGIVSPASDVWSVGVTLVAALTQNVSFVEEGSPSGRDVPGTVPEPFRGIARECLHLDPKRRCSIAQIQSRLQPAGRSVPAAPPPPPPVREPMKRARIMAILLVIAILVAAIVFWSHRKSATAPANPTAQQAEPSPTQSAPAAKPNPTVPEPTVPAANAIPGQGGVVRQVLPDISQSARNTISGTIKIVVRVEADPTGKVTAARLKTAGPSQYFARLTVAAAQRWQFSAPQVNGQPIPSTWLLTFRVKRSGTQASAEAVTR